MGQEADRLFAYLKDILYNPGQACLKVEELPEDYRRLGEGMQFLAKCVQETRSFAMAMAKGDLSQTPPDGENVLAAPIKELQNSLRHLAWQTQEVAKGDYSQTVDFMGEFSHAFNTMIRQLKERQEGLIAEKQLTQVKNLELERNLELVINLTNFIHNMIFVYSAQSHELLFSNESARAFCMARPNTAKKVLDIICAKEQEHVEQAPIWEMEVEKVEGEGTEYFGVESYYISWKDQMALVFILIDDTERKKKEKLMYRLAFGDPLTGLSNRRYAMGWMKKLIKEMNSFTMAFVDVDYLKYCNDTYGHKAGDDYLKKTAQGLKSLGGEVCRVGGDEFIVIFTGVSCKEAETKLEALRTKFQENSRETPYPESFSYAVTQVPSPPEKSLEEYIQFTDHEMYQYKLYHKLPLEDLLYVDSRMGRQN